MHAFDGKVVFITGASSGIGRALALDLARFETRLGLFARRAELLDELSREVLEKGAADAISLPGDVKDPEVLKSAVGRVIERWGRVDVAILSAGVGKPANLKRYDLEKIRNTLETNLLGVVNAAGALLPVFRSQGGGVLVGISSLADRRGSPLNLAYCASKAGVTTFLEGLRAGCKREGIRVVTVKPGFVRTPMAEKNQFSMPFLVEPEDAARRILRGVERRKDVIRFPMPMVCLTSLYNRLPNWLFDRIFGR
jgi:NAD(P)-dependent dehydrogenase (short-subunit alcohol dehydrogenase family)